MAEARLAGHGPRSAVQQHLVAEDGAGQRLDKVLSGSCPACPAPASSA